MTTLDLTQNLQAQLDGSGDLKTLEGRDEIEQHLELKIIARLHDVLSEYEADHVESKIELEAKNAIQSHDRFIDSISSGPTVTEIEGAKSGFKVQAELVESGQIEAVINDI